MAKIALAMATTHGPQLHTTAEQWTLRVSADKKNMHPFRDGVYSFDELVDLRKGENLAERSSMDNMKKAQARCHDAMVAMADKWEEAGADVAIIFGNDQHEIYGDDLNPAFMVYYGAKICNHPRSEEGRAALPPGIKEGEFGHATEVYTEYDGIPELGEHIIKTVVDEDFDVAASKTLPKGTLHSTGVSHAFGHIYRQVMRDKVVPNVPIYQNTFFPPNQPSARRAYEFGKAVKKAVNSWASDKKVAVFASGGMSHFVIDEEFDQRFIKALKERDTAWLTSIPKRTLQAGTSELKSWITLAGFLEDEDTRMHEIDYIPCYRSPAGTGTAQGFYWWDVR
ncbi:MAG: protocatechuate 3,4-dioxygenase [Hyphomicrobiales bacterium]|nr:protocatechuate 3,4-dioxygenase [Hyphomicrobiales bacterium]